MAHAIGIDLGTTNSVVAFLEDTRAEVIANAEGGKTTPSVVLYPESGASAVVGEMAKRQMLVAPGRTVRSVKRLMGRRFQEVQDYVHELPYRIQPGPNGEAVIVIGDRTMTPEEVSAAILKKMCATAEDYLGEDITQAVITVPAYFNDSQRTATKRAGEMAGLEIIRIINEPTAAALAYGLKREAVERVAVFDFGGGTFDISILDVDQDVFEVRSTNGDTFLGGDNIDQALCDYVCDAIAKDTGLDARGFPESLQRIRETAEKVKCELSTLAATVVSLPFIVSDASGPRHFNREVTRAEFERLIEPIVARLAPPCLQAMRDANLRPEDISTVLLVGGSTRIPAVQRLVREIFGKEPSKAVSPDEAVALGASIQAGVLTGALQEVLLLDVTPLSLGIELEGGVFSALIPRNSTIPTSVTKSFTTVRDNQTTVRIHVLQGERRMASENRTLAHFELTGVEPAPREIPQIDVKFTIDANGILNVSAMDLSSGAMREMTIEAYAQAGAGESERVVMEAETHADEDRAFIALSRARVRALRVADKAREYLKRKGARLALEEEKTIRGRLLKLDMAMAGADISAIDEAEKSLRELSEMFEDLIFIDRLA